MVQKPGERTICQQDLWPSTIYDHNLCHAFFFGKLYYLLLVYDMDKNDEIMKDIADRKLHLWAFPA